MRKFILIKVCEALANENARVFLGFFWVLGVVFFFFFFLLFTVYTFGKSYLIKKLFQLESF